MAVRTYESECIALMQLETALVVYDQGEDYFSVITLAGASEEILGKLVKRQGKENSIESLKKAACAVHKYLYGVEIKESEYANRANYARNIIKHVDPSVESHITFDAEEEARDMLTRAIDNYWLAKETLTPGMEHFERSRREV